jgi:hypothetical protein
MRKNTWAARFGAVLFAICATLVLPISAFAADGEVGNVGDSDSVSGLYLSGGHVTMDIEYTHDCPTGISDCWYEVRFAHKCPEPWCLDVHYQSWRRVNSVGTAQADCINDDGEYWEAWIRMGFTTVGTKTVQYWGESERYLSASGSIQYKNIAEAEFNVTDQHGTKTSILIETATAQTDVTNGTIVSTSGGQLIDEC